MPLPDLEIVKQAIGYEFGPMSYSYVAQDVILYALGIGAPADPLDQAELKFVYELSSRGFQVLPTFAVNFSRDLIAQLLTGQIAGIKYNPMNLVHGEQELEVYSALPPAATVVSSARIADICDKGSGMLVTIGVDSRGEDGAPLARARTSVFIRGLGGYGGNRGARTEAAVPNRAPDGLREETTMDRQALLYRLAGDANPLHADPKMAAIGKFEKPILHGLCTLGFAARALLKRFGRNEASNLRTISARFAGHVFPGETLITEMWQVSAREIAFQTTVKERGAIVLSRARAQLKG